MFGCILGEKLTLIMFVSDFLRVFTPVWMCELSTLCVCVCICVGNAHEEQTAVWMVFVCVRRSVYESVCVGVSAACPCDVDSSAHLLVFVCVCVCMWVYAYVQTSHLHGTMPHRFHWGVWEQRLSISSAAVPAGKSLIIISWMMSLRHAPRSRPVAASLQHPPTPFSPTLLSIFSASFSFSISGAFFLFIISRTCCVLLPIYLLFSSLSFCPCLIPWLWLTPLFFLSAVLPFFPALSLSLRSSDTLLFVLNLFFLKLEEVRGTRLTLNCLVQTIRPDSIKWKRHGAEWEICDDAYSFPKHQLTRSLTSSRAISDAQVLVRSFFLTL